MRGITIMYEYDGPEDRWEKVVGDFLAAIDADAEVAGKFTYQVARADDGRTRIHWGRWDSPETLARMQSTAYFKTFAADLKELAGGPPKNVAADVFAKTTGW